MRIFSRALLCAALALPAVATVVCDSSDEKSDRDDDDRDKDDDDDGRDRDDEEAPAARGKKAKGKAKMAPAGGNQPGQGSGGDVPDPSREVPRTDQALFSSETIYDYSSEKIITWYVAGGQLNGASVILLSQEG